MTNRNIPITSVKSALGGEKFNFNYRGESQTGYYDSQSKVFVPQDSSGVLRTAYKCSRAYIDKKNMGGTMKLEYHKRSDMMYIYMQSEEKQKIDRIVKRSFKDGPIRLDFMVDEQLFGIEIKNASKMVDLEYLRNLKMGPFVAIDMNLYMQNEKTQEINGIVKETRGEFPIQLDFMGDGRLFGIELLNADKMVDFGYIKKYEFIEMD